MYRPLSRRVREIYGIMGGKGHGKDTFARLVTEANARQSRSHRGSAKAVFAIHHFAGALKRMSARIFGLKDDQMHDPSLKEAALSSPVDMDLFVDAMCLETGLAIQPAGKIARSAREILQFFGTEYVRRAQSDYWIQRLLHDASQRRVLVPDTRFANEVTALRSVGGRIIKIVRIDIQPTEDAHASEEEQKTIEPDLLIATRTGDLSLPSRVANLVALGKFDAALRYDYRRALRAIQSYTSGASVEDSARLLGQKHKDPYALHNLLSYYGVPLRRPAKNRVPHQVVDGVICKFCGACSRLLPIAENFNLGSKAWDGLAGICRKCASEANKHRYEKYSKVDSLSAMFAIFKRSAVPRGIAFDLSLSDLNALWVKQQGRCAYTGRIMSFALHDPDKVSLDRLDSTAGYCVDNVVLCTTRVNYMKRSMTVTEFKSIVDDLYKHLHGKEARDE